MREGPLTMKELSLIRPMGTFSRREKEEPMSFPPEGFLASGLVATFLRLCSRCVRCRTDYGGPTANSGVPLVGYLPR